MPSTTNKGLPVLVTSDQGLPIPDLQAYFQSFATALDARVEQIGSSYNSAADTIASTTYTNPVSTFDRVQNVVVPTDGLLAIYFAGLWKINTASAQFGAALFIGANQLKNPNTSSGGAPVLQEALQSPSTPNFYGYMYSHRAGLGVTTGPAADTTLVTTGMLLADTQYTADGGACYVQVAAGTYDISVKYKCAAGATATVKERRLWVHSIQCL